MAMAVSITMVMVRMTPTSPGTTNTAVRRSGLYQVVGSSWIGCPVAVAPWAATRWTISSAEREATRDAAVFVALATVWGSLPSTTSWTWAVVPERRSEA